jgi:hypothetical protein
VTEVLPSGESSLRILDAASGAVLGTIRNPGVMLFTDPKFAGANQVITAARLSDGRMALASVDIASGALEWLTPASYNVIGYPNVYNGTVYFTASVTGNDELYALQLKDKKIYRLTQTELGNYYVNASGNRLTWSAFTADGYCLRQMKQEESLREPVNPLAMQEVSMLLSSAIAGGDAYADSTVTHAPPRIFPDHKYRKADHLFYPHSWQPFYSDPDFYYSLYSDNILNTLSAELFYHYNREDKTHGVGLNATYAQWFPHINRGIEFTMDRPARVNGNPTRINTLEAKLGLSVPLNFSRGKSYRLLNAGTDYVFNWRYFKGAYKDSLPTVQYNSVHHFLYWTQFIQSARQHIFPRLGYSLSLNYRYAVSYYKGYQFAGAAALYLPGLLRIHNLVLTGGFQQRDTSRLLFGNLLASARGYSGYYETNAGSRMWRLSANYHFPLWLPDWGFGDLLYIRRIRANLFYDRQRLYANDRIRTIDLASTGGEIYFDTRWWNQLPVTLGFRISHLLNDDPLGGYAKGSNLFEFIIPVDLIPR